ncbi:MAG: hypothetical protein ACYDA6_00115 [Solirubrobacteraceae bacterium]
MVDDRNPLPEAFRVWQLLRLGVSLTEQGVLVGDGSAPAVLLDQLSDIEGASVKAQNDQVNRGR